MTRDGIYCKTWERNTYSQLCQEFFLAASTQNDDGFHAVEYLLIVKNVKTAYNLRAFTVTGSKRNINYCAS